MNPNDYDESALFACIPCERDREICDLLEYDHTPEYIADELNVPINTVWAARKEWRRLKKQWENTARLIDALDNDVTA